MLKQYEHLDQSDDFVGSQFKTPTGGILTVVGIDRAKGRKKYFCSCSICSEDSELWNIEDMCIGRATLYDGSIPCGCARSVVWTERQNFLRVKREAFSRGYKFFGWAGEYRRSATRLYLYNPTTDNSWSTCSLSNFIVNKRGDPVEGINKNRKSKIKPDIDHIFEFMSTGKYLNGTKFWRSNRVNLEGKKRYWHYTCPKCSNDEYVKAGVCDGVFESYEGSLKSGMLACRCATNYRWCQQEREYQLDKICENEDLSFLGWVSDNGYENIDSKFQWRCSRGHKTTTSVDGFLAGKRCLQCRNENSSVNGRYSERDGEQDWLYLQLSKPWIKCGRTFRVTERRKENEDNSGEKLDEIALYTGSHKQVYELEQFIRDLMEEECLNYYPLNEYPWIGCRECYDNSQESVERIREIIHNSSLEIVHEDGFNS